MKSITPLLVAAFLSGAAALCYELLWMREFTLLAGSTQAAVSCVLSLYFLGLALGNFAAGKIAWRLKHPMLLYCILELGIGVWAFLFRPLLAGLDPLYAQLYQNLSAGSPMILPLRAATAGILLLVPVTAMGATIPLLVQFSSLDLPGAWRRSAWFYGINTLGAMVGASLTGFFLIEHLGVSKSLMLTGLLNGTCALLALPFLRQVRVGEDGEPDTTPLTAISWDGKMVIAFFGLLGACNIAYEVLWTRYYALIFFNDTYIFTTILIVFLAGIGAGSLAGNIMGRFIERPVYVMGVLQLVSSACSVWMIYLVPSVAEGFLGLTNGDFGDLLSNYFSAVIYGTTIQTICMGLTFAMAVRAVTRERSQSGKAVGLALGWNTLGGVVGGAAGGFLLLDKIGLQSGLLITSGLTALAGTVLCLSSPGGKRSVWKPLAGLILPVLLLLVIFPPNLPDSLVALHFKPGEKIRILDSMPSVHGTVTVTEAEDGERRVWINNAWVAREKGHTALGYIPWIFHPGPVRSALGLCFGTGRTFGALINAGVPRADLVDINSAVVAMGGKWLERSNYGVITDPRASIIIDDGRNFVRYRKEKYDLITLEPLQMFHRGVVYFYTAEFYQQALARLNDGGVIAQWLPLYIPSIPELKSMVKTFIQVFPNALLWGSGSDTVLLGFKSPGTSIDFDEQEIFRRAEQPGVRRDLRQDIIYKKYDPLAFVILDSKGLAQLSGGGEIYRDDRPVLEFSAPRNIGSLRDNLALIRRYLVDPGQLFDLPDRRTADLMRRMRDLNHETLTEARPLKEVQREFREIHAKLYERETPFQ